MKKQSLLLFSVPKAMLSRPTLSVKRIGELIHFIKERKPDVLCMVDNCYGEFVEIEEPSQVGADLIVGSLIKNPGGGLAPIGGYLCGTKECIDRADLPSDFSWTWQRGGSNAWRYNFTYTGTFLSTNSCKGRVKGCGFCGKYL